MRRPPIALLVLLSAATALVPWAMPAAASTEASADAVDVMALIAETQQQSPEPDRLAFVWWLPEAFWSASMAQNPTLTAEGIEEVLETLRPYVVFFVADGALGPLGGVTFTPAASVRESLSLTDFHGVVHRPLPEVEVSSDAKNLFAVMRPILASVIGPLAENMEAYFFPATTSEGEPTVSESAEGTFTVRLGEESFDWRTPLSSVLEPRFCPVDGESMSGAWSYCPWHGKELLDEAPSGD